MKLLQRALWNPRCRTVPVRHKKSTVGEEPFLSGAAGSYLEEMFNIWRREPSKVHSSWDVYFKKAIAGAQPGEAYQSPLKPGTASISPSGAVSTMDKEHLVILDVINAYQTNGYLRAKLDPLHGKTIKKDHFSDPEAWPEEHVKRLLQTPDGKITYGTLFNLPDTTFIGGSSKQLTLREIVLRLDETYCKNIGVEYMHITNHHKCQWIRQQFEPPGVNTVTEEEKRLVFDRLVETSGFEAFLFRKWTVEKRFGIEGCDILIPAMRHMIDRASKAGVDTFMIGAAHRGRMNIIANICQVPLNKIFTQFMAATPVDTIGGDVKYHLGTNVRQLNVFSGMEIVTNLVANPSHLEATGPVVQGRTRGEQFKKRDETGAKVMSIIVHGDAAFSGEGIVYETLQLTHLPCFSTRGTIHLVVNNQVGFTTDPEFSRSTPYCTDVAKIVQAPIFHVNGDVPEDVIHCSKVALDYRNRFHNDVVIDIVSYRRFGHNETDEPAFTQPIMYKIIRDRKPLLELYSKKLIEEKVMTETQVKEITDKYTKHCEEEYKISEKTTTFDWKDWMDTKWVDFFHDRNQLQCGPTGVKEEILLQIGKKSSEEPPAELNFQLHKGINRVLKERMDLLAQKRVNWALGEILAFGSLLKEGVHVRLTGQDVERGTFSHRHHVLHDQVKEGETYVPLQHLDATQAEYHVCNSTISEYSVLGFEVGFSVTDPHYLVIWEAQFGDFNNNAQTVIDTYMAAGESKWTRQSGIVMLNPHGLEGMGPEHSSARIERFLQMTNDDPDEMPDINDELFAMRQLHETNWIVANCSTPANLFHILRRQIALPFRKPLILFTPKSLLRLPEARSDISEMLEGTEFLRIIPDKGPVTKEPGKVKKHLLCSGKVFYDIVETRKERQLESDIAITRVEQLCPFPYDLLLQEIRKYPNAELCWTQEEHKNYGPWSYVLQRMSTAIRGTNVKSITYIGRSPAAAPATGSKGQHNLERKQLLEYAMKF